MRKYLLLVISVVVFVYAETLFEVKDASNNKVLDVSTDGLRILNQGDTVMVISANEIKANLQNSKGLSRAFSVTTTQSKGDGNDLMRLTADSTRFWISDTGSGFGVSSQTALKQKSVSTNFLKVTNDNTEMREGLAGDRYTDFSPENMFLGLNAGKATTPSGSTSGQDNIFIGNESGIINSTGYKNIFIGAESGRNSNSYDGTFIGYKAGYNNASSSNIFIGNFSGYANTTGFINTYLGHYTGNVQQSGIYNTYIGYSAGANKTSGNYNTFVGSLAGQNNSTGSSNVFIGNGAGGQETGSNRLYIDNYNTADPLIYGEFDTNKLKINGYLGVGKIPDPSYKLDVLSSSYAGNFYANTTTGDHTRGLYARANGGSSSNYGIYASASGTGATNYAGYFSGNVYVTGNMYANDYIEFKSDHPLDPENKTLSHSSVSSSEMLNVYSGNIVLDGKGNAIVQMPDWFEAYNAEFRYQLTGIGSSAPGLFISKELNSGEFGIGGGNPGMKVSWMVTAVRNDNYAKANPVQVVTEKKEKEKGYYLTPEVFGRYKDLSIESVYEKEVDIRPVE
ncbi:MAG: hypothetical protein JXN63_08620 [Candidatus Delongbacteria bacterium]|nr:hypothetical protein [Candidatus Delongbacteria bacterium]